MAKTEAFSQEEKDAMKARAKEAREFKKLSGEEQIRIKLQELSEDDRNLAMAVHDLVLETAPELKPRTWYGMPAYYLDDKVICFFQPAGQFKSRYASFGFQEAANLDDGEFWPTSFAITGLNEKTRNQIAGLVKKAVMPHPPAQG
jgi:uncharacterized protein YdhG (YjbR/CyaY superfamily)